MKPRLKEEPREWQKFAIVIATLVAGISLVLRLRNVLSQNIFTLIVAGSVLILLGSLFEPRWFRNFYRIGMAASFYVGQVIGSVLLALFFLLIVTPIGLTLRLLGKDLLNLKPNSAASTYWRAAKTPARLDQQF
jgi:hypothetical protein